MYKYCKYVFDGHDIFNPIDKLPFECRTLVDAIHIARISDNLYALTKVC